MGGQVQLSPVTTGLGWPWRRSWLQMKYFCSTLVHVRQAAYVEHALICRALCANLAFSVDRQSRYRHFVFV